MLDLDIDDEETKYEEFLKRIGAPNSNKKN
jgi:hypothetical protein